MFTKALALFALVASARCGPGALTYQASYPVAAQTYVADSPHVGFQSEQTVRGFAGSSVSHQQKAIDSAFSSVRKTDTRITNPALYATAAVAPAVYSHAPVLHQQAYAAPAYQQTYAAPAYQQTYAAPAPVYQQTYAAAPAPVYQQTYAAAPAQVYQQTYSPAPVYAAGPVAAPLVAKAHPVAYAQHAYAAPAIAKVASPLLGVQYSAVSPGVASLNFNGYGISYGY